MKIYSRPRPFVALTKNGGRELTVSSCKKPPKKYMTELIGPFKTFAAARLYVENPHIFLKSIRQWEILAKEAHRSTVAQVNGTERCAHCKVGPGLLHRQHCLGGTH